VTDPNPDPPPTLEAAEEKFSAFLQSQNYPKAIRWVRRGEVLVDTKRCYWIKPHRAKAMTRAAYRYAEGLERNLGIELRVICATETETFACATETETFAFVFVPEDDLDAQRPLMTRELKLSCPVERYSTFVTRNPLRWLALWLSNGQRSKMLEM